VVYHGPTSAADNRSDPGRSYHYAKASTVPLEANKNKSAANETRVGYNSRAEVETWH
jgi:hypothetical protein